MFASKSTKQWQFLYLYHLPLIKGYRNDRYKSKTLKFQFKNYNKWFSYIDQYIDLLNKDANINNVLELESIDTLTNFIIELQKKYDLMLLDKINVCYKQGEFVQYKDLKEFKKLIKARGVSQKTIVFDNMISTVEELEFDWEINIMDSFLGRLLQK